ncbi:glycosyltransferase family 4 protein [Candidatus Kaiserbacteria bacterium]|nr:glycosyltransferase family 4 protein [Candidatus Kaiserbacteria bacterium]
MARLLIVTQAVDAEDPVLGFFVRWLAEFSRRLERIEVICLTEGGHALPGNVRVHSLGKRTGTIYHTSLARKLRYTARFLGIVWKMRHGYDCVFVHMNQEYVLLGGLLWRLWGKKVFLWRNHAKGDIGTRLAVLLAHKIFYTSPQSFTARFRKARRMPVGIDTDFFKPDASFPAEPNSILFLGRIAPVKKVEEFIEALHALQEQGVEFSATVAGPVLPLDADYEKRVRMCVSAYGLESKVRFLGPVTQEEARALYREHFLYVNLTSAGSMDKTIFEAMACETPVLAANEALLGEIDSRCVLGAKGEEISARLKEFLSLPPAEKASLGGALREYVVRKHSLRKLAGAIAEILR